MDKIIHQQFVGLRSQNDERCVNWNYINKKRG